MSDSQSYLLLGYKLRKAQKRLANKKIKQKDLKQEYEQIERLWAALSEPAIYRSPGTLNRDFFSS